MKILFDIVHPADVLFFHHPIDALTKSGHDVLILSREKDITCELLDAFKRKHACVSKAKQGIIGLAAELFIRETRIFRWAKRFRPDIMVGFGGVSISHVGKILRIPTVSFYDTESASVQNRIAFPFIDYLFLPKSFHKKINHHQISRFPGTKELSYLHPDTFRPNIHHARKCGYDESRENFFIRIVSWRASHDIGKTGWPEDLFRIIVGHLSKIGKVHISSERKLPNDLDPLKYSGSVSGIHHLLAHCRLYVGESATMAAEAAVLGIPSIYAPCETLGYIKELESFGLVRTMKEMSSKIVIEEIDKFLLKPSHDYAQRKEEYLSDKINLTDYIIEALAGIYTQRRP